MTIEAQPSCPFSIPISEVIPRMSDPSPWVLISGDFRRGRGARVIVNGANCICPEINWAHYVHQVWNPESGNAPWCFQQKTRLHHKWAKRDNRAAFRIAQLVITNSELPRQHVLDCFELDP